MDDAENTGGILSNFNAEVEKSKVRWSRKRKVPLTFQLQRVLARRLIAALPPVTGRTVIAWAVVPVSAALLWGWVSYVGTQVDGNRSVDDQVRWTAYAFGVLVALIFLFVPAGLTEDQRKRRVLFRAGAIERARVIGYDYEVTSQRRMVRIHLASILRVRRMLGVAAIQMPDHRYVFLPGDLFPSRADWAGLQALLSSR
jgi:hypothetical protein